MPENTPLTPEIEKPASLPSQPVTAAGPESNAPTKTKKKKKNKKKVPKQRPDTLPSDATTAPQDAPESHPATPTSDAFSSPAEASTDSPAELLTLPVKPDEWFINPATYDDSGNPLTEETLVFYHDGLEILTIPFNTDNLSALTEILKERFSTTPGNTEADYFHVRKPFIDSDEALPVMTLTQKNRVLATTTLDQKTLKKLIKALQAHVINTSPVTAWLNRWWHKHKIMRVILIILSLPVVGILIYTAGWGMGR